MRRTSAAIVAATASLLLVAGCTRGGDDEPAGDLPDGAELLSAGADEMAKVTTARFRITTEGTVDRLGIRGAEGVLTREGDAQGKAQLDQNGVLVELEFVVVGETLHIKGPTGGWQQLPAALAASVYDPTAILDPERGAAHVLKTATGARTLARESVDGVDTYKVEATFNGQALAGLAPGITQDVKGTAWIGADRRLLHKVSFPVPGPGGGGTVTVTFREFDAPVTVRAP